jgi:hypothetical protein
LIYEIIKKKLDDLTFLEEEPKTKKVKKNSDDLNYDNKDLKKNQKM